MSPFSSRFCIVVVVHDEWPMASDEGVSKSRCSMVTGPAGSMGICSGEERALVFGNKWGFQYHGNSGSGKRVRRGGIESWTTHLMR